MSGTEYGLRCKLDGRETVLLQISGGGRIRVSSAGRIRWIRPPNAPWEVFETSAIGQTYSTRDEAEYVARNLTSTRTD